MVKFLFFEFYFFIFLVCKVPKNLCIIVSKKRRILHILGWEFVTKFYEFLSYLCENLFIPVFIYRN